jgi:hypothetical protein
VYPGRKERRGERKSTSIMDVYYVVWLGAWRRRVGAIMGNGDGSVQTRERKI